ncbi:L-idonate 5-dehydrogenase [Mycetocola zhadangensis]|uniref:L-idonate 5-dehydrogenase n=1 Tax=Mycetocola zhadangensis TaxID=1164595 RepID=UPI003A4D1FA4
MRAAIIEGKDQLDVVDLPMPVPGEGQVRVRVAAVGICGSDLHYHFEGANGEYVVKEPLIPGHELSGWVNEDPSGQLQVGEPVTVHPARFGASVDGIEDAAHLWPGGSYLGSAATTPHTQGGMSEFLVVERHMIRQLPAGLSVEDAALAEPLGVALHGATRAGDLSGRRVLVSGAGPIGLLALVAAKARGAAHVTVSDVLAAPLARATELGADTTVQVSVEALPAEAFDVVLECSGAAVAISAAVAAVRRRGTVVQVGMVPNEARPINLAPFISKEVTMVGSFRFLEEIDEAITLLAADPGIARIITHRFPIDHVREAFAVARDSEQSGKVVVTFTDEH